MAQMSKVKILSITVALLFICNVALLWQQWQGNKPQHRGEGPRREIIARLKLDDKQVMKYDVLVNEHRHQMREKEEEMRQLKKALYQTLLSDNNQRAAIIQAIGQQQQLVEEINLQHFEDIGQLCQPEQQADYIALVADLSDLFMHKRPPPPARH
jgi:Spy/CpxP family protein refolding chaperone